MCLVNCKTRFTSYSAVEAVSLLHISAASWSRQFNSFFLSLCLDLEYVYLLLARHGGCRPNVWKGSAMTSVATFSVTVSCCASWSPEWTLIQMCFHGLRTLVWTTWRSWKSVPSFRSPRLQNSWNWRFHVATWVRIEERLFFTRIVSLLFG